MANPYFRFKQFTVWHDKCAMKVGTDGVLLGAWSDVSGIRRVLDVGTGTGLIALMIAQRSDAFILALEIDADAVSQARQNILGSPWNHRIEVIHQDFKTYASGDKFDLIVSNPPYFTGSLESPEEHRTVARHDKQLGYHELLHKVVDLLSDHGRFCVIIPTSVSDVVKQMAKGMKLYPSKQLNMITTPGKTPKRSLIEFVKVDSVSCETREMLIELQRHQYSPEYVALTKEFYLHM